MKGKPIGTVTANLLYDNFAQFAIIHLEVRSIYRQKQRTAFVALNTAARPSFRCVTKERAAPNTMTALSYHKSYCNNFCSTCDEIYTGHNSDNCNMCHTWTKNEAISLEHVSKHFKWYNIDQAEACGQDDTICTSDDTSCHQHRIGIHRLHLQGPVKWTK